MFALKSICWFSIFGGFAFGISDRWLNGDLFSVGVAMVCVVIFMPLCPLFKNN